MKSRRKSSSSSKSKSRPKRSGTIKRRKTTSSRTKPKTRTPRGRSTIQIASQLGPPPSPTEPDYKTCQEPEVGDIGGFGDVDAYESHEKLCGERATDYCTACAKNLCNNHFLLMHQTHERSAERLVPSI